MKKSFRVYGTEGHRQKEAFNQSHEYDFSRDGKTRKITVLNQDMTGTYDYSIVRIECDTEEEIYAELNGQLSDGIFENVRYGKVEEIA